MELIHTLYILGAAFMTFAVVFIAFAISTLKDSNEVCRKHGIKLKTHGYYDEKYCPKCWTEMIKEATKR